MIITPTGTPVDVERRGAMMGSWPNGYGLTDPAAIPPPGLGSQQRAGVPVTVHTALQVDSVMTSLRVLSNMIIKLGDPRAYTEELNADNLPYRQWCAEQPQILTKTWAPGVFQFDGQARTVVSLALFSEAWWYTLEFDRMQRPTALEVLNPAIVETKPDGTIWYGTGSSKVQLDRTRVTHIPFMALPGGQRGLSSIEYEGVAYALALAAMEYGARWFGQGASPSFILSTEQKLGTDEVRRIAEKFMVEHSGLQAAHLPLVVDSGLKVEKVQSTPDQAQFLGTLEYARRVIAAYFGLPSHLVGGAKADSTWGGTVEQQAIQMVATTLSGYTVRLNEAYSSLLPNQPQNIKAALDESAWQATDAKTLGTFGLQMRTAGAITSNELRQRYLFLPPHADGNELLMPLNSNASKAMGAAFADEVDNLEDDIDLDPQTLIGLTKTATSSATA